MRRPWWALAVALVLAAVYSSRRRRPGLAVPMEVRYRLGQPSEWSESAWIGGDG